MSSPVHIRPIYNHPTLPESSPRHQGGKVQPVTRRDLGTDFRAYMKFETNDWRSSVMFDAVKETDLATVTMLQWYGNIEIREARQDPSRAGQTVPGWEEAARKHAARGFYVYFNSMAKSQIARAPFEKVLEIFGPRFIGFNEGEWDAAYLGMVANGTLALSPARSREEACRHYLEWLDNTHKIHHRRMLSMSVMGFGCHYGGEIGTRMLAIETSQGAPSSSILMVFCRGAGKQYDLLIHTVPSVFSTRGGAPYTSGLKCYPYHGQPQSLVMPQGMLAGPEHGSSLGLLKRRWWLSHMNGAVITGFECSCFSCNAVGEYEAQGAVELPAPFRKQDVHAQLTPLGWIHWEAIQTVRRHPVRGVPYIPFAVMLPVAHGWHPQGPFFSEDPNLRNCVWGNIPYNAGDWQIDKFFRWTYPGYNLAHDQPCLDERGILVNTPFGDSFDAILANAEDACLAKYQAVILLGSLDVDADPALKGRLERFMGAGGTVVADHDQWQSAVGTAVPADSLFAVVPHGEGRFAGVTEPAWAANAPDETRFRTITASLETLLRSYLLIEIQGRPVYSLVNVTDRPDELIVSHCNNSRAASWEGIVEVKDQEVVETEEWLAFGEADIHNGALRCVVPANDVRVIRIRTRKNFIPLAHAELS